MRIQAVLTSLHVFQDEAARCISLDRAFGVFIGTVQYDFGVGDHRAASILHDATHATERGLPKRERGVAQEQTAGENRKEPLIERPGEEPALLFSVDTLGSVLRGAV